MLKLERHLTEDELLALRDGKDDDFVRLDHLQECKRCRKRLGFLGAFKAALKRSLEAPPEVESAARHADMLPEQFASERLSEPVDSEVGDSCCASLATSPPPTQHPDPETLAAYFDGGLAGWERDSVQEHLVRCERCMADVLVLVAGKGEGLAGEDLRTARRYFREHGSTVAYEPGAALRVRPQLELELVDQPETGLVFRILARPGRTARPRPGRRDLDDRVEVMVGTARATITAHRDGGTRHLDVHVRDLARPRAAAATVSLEQEGRAILSVRTGKGGKASVAVPDLPVFDLRVDGGWPIPVLLRFRG